MPTQEETVLAAADRLWASGKRPTNRALIAVCGGSARDIAPALRKWWQQKTATDASAPPQRAIADIEQRMDEQRRYFLLQIDNERQRTRELEAQLAAAQRTLARYRKLLSDTTPR